ncbi:patatin-like phospholipase family protein [Bacteriovorax stolpii]|uniref:patatin-like phospholipase family protein n=1 Tax=Bacteriovorax stolpii TaxID=960 RepID=UPI0011578D4E|nr:patatin-like phospholipase family protein [Bacteriovorax stolpii]QDK42890.1 patatin-like phospholipase family protein [Bacteriovorax stolpii]
MSHPKFGLVLSGGGARAAYQAGVLKGLIEIIGNKVGDDPFQVITGISAGAINAAYLASAKNDFNEQVQSLNRIWGELAPENVLRTDIASLGKLSAGWIKDLSFGGILGKSESTHLLDSTPLRNLLEDSIDFDQIEKNILNKRLHGVAVSTTSYATGTSVTFFDSQEVKDYSRSARIGLNGPLRLEHVLASAAIPFIFSPVRIKNSFYGDGGVRSNAPLSPAIHLGADRILAIGVRYFRNELEVKELNQQVEMNNIVLADIVGVLFNSLFLDAIEFDYERLQRINKTVSLLSEEARAAHPGQLKSIPTLLIQPSVDLGELAGDQFHRFPKMLRYLLSGIGATEARGADLLSYIAFDKAYTQKLVDIGYKDAHDRAYEIREFFQL